MNTEARPVTFIRYISLHRALGAHLNRGDHAAHPLLDGLEGGGLPGFTELGAEAGEQTGGTFARALQRSARPLVAIGGEAGHTRARGGDCLHQREGLTVGIK